MNRIVLCLLPALLLAEDPKPMTPPANTNTANSKSVAPQPIAVAPELQVQMALIDKQVEIIRLQACSEAGIKHTECSFDWQKRTVTRKAKPPKPQVP